MTERRADWDEPSRAHWARLARSWLSTTEQVPDARIQVVTDQTLLRRVGLPEEVAEAALFLASDRASFITGQILAANGGAIGYYF